MAGYGVEGAHPALNAVQAIQIPSSDPGAEFALPKTGKPGGAMHVAPLGAANYGANRFTAWDTSSFGANRGASNVSGSFVNFNSNQTPYPPAGG
jgi:hypothetical protein